MQIGIDITPLTKTPTGVGLYTRYLLRELVSLESPDRFCGLATGVRTLDEENIPVRHVHLPLPTRMMYQLYHLARRPHADTLLGGVDVFHAVNYVLPPLKRARGVLSIHDLGFLRDAGWFSPKIMRPFARAIRDGTADTVIAVSEATAKDVCSFLDVALKDTGDPRSRG